MSLFLGVYRISTLGRSLTSLENNIFNLLKNKVCKLKGTTLYFRLKVANLNSAGKIGYKYYI